MTQSGHERLRIADVQTETVRQKSISHGLIFAMTGTFSSTYPLPSGDQVTKSRSGGRSIESRSPASCKQRAATRHVLFCFLPRAGDHVGHLYCPDTDQSVGVRFGSKIRAWADVA